MSNQKVDFYMLMQLLTADKYTSLCGKIKFDIFYNHSLSVFHVSNTIELNVKHWTEDVWVQKAVNRIKLKAG